MFSGLFVVFRSFQRLPKVTIHELIVSAVVYRCCSFDGLLLPVPLGSWIMFDPLEPSLCQGCVMSRRRGLIQQLCLQYPLSNSRQPVRESRVCFVGASMYLFKAYPGVACMRQKHCAATCRICTNWSCWLVHFYS